MVMETVLPIVRDGEPLSAALILRLQVWVGERALKETLHDCGDAPEPLTVTAKAHDVPLFEQVIV